MGQVHAQAERTIAVSPQEVYTFLADYRNKRPQILTENFLNYAVEEGGQGSGTVVTYRLHAANRERPYRMIVTETTPGRVLTEKDAGSSLVTTWTLTPTADNQQTRVQLASNWQGGSGVRGFFEKTFAPMGLRRIYNEMLGKLEASLKAVHVAS